MTSSRRFRRRAPTSRHAQQSARTSPLFRSNGHLYGHKLTKRPKSPKGIGWEAGTRTPIHWSRASCPTIERPPSRSAGARLSGKPRGWSISRGLPRGEFSPKREWKLRVHEDPPLHVASACSGPALTPHGLAARPWASTAGLVHRCALAPAARGSSLHDPGRLLALRRHVILGTHVALVYNPPAIIR